MQAENASQPPDAIFGAPTQKPLGHLLFRWLTCPNGTVTAGHFDLLEPGEGEGLKLPQEAPIHFLDFSPNHDFDDAVDSSHCAEPICPESSPCSKARVSTPNPYAQVKVLNILNASFVSQPPCNRLFSKCGSYLFLSGSWP